MTTVGVWLERVITNGLHTNTLQLTSSITFWNWKFPSLDENSLKVWLMVRLLQLQRGYCIICVKVSDGSINIGHCNKFASMIGAGEIMSYALHSMIHSWCNMWWEEFLDCQQILIDRVDIQRLWWEAWDELRFIVSLTCWWWGRPF